MNSRPAALVVVVGTTTGIGKTWTTAALATELRGNGSAVAVRKPTQSFDPHDGAPTDAEVLAAATGDAVERVRPPHRSYALPMAPPMAAEALGKSPFTVEDLVNEVRWPDTTHVGLIETAGGVRSPLADNGTAVDLCEILTPDSVVLVSDAGLGAINAVRLSLAPLTNHRVIVFLNHFDAANGVHLRNRDWLAQRDGLHITTSISEIAANVTRLPV